MHKVQIALACASAVVLAIAIMIIVSLRQYVEATDSVSRIGEIRLLLAQALSEIKDAETAQRGYALSGNPWFLDPLASAMRRLPDRLDQLRALSADNRVRRARVDAFIRQVDRKIAFVNRNVQQRAAGDAEGATTAIVGGHGQRLMDGVRELAAEIDADERTLLATRVEKMQTMRMNIIVALCAGVFTALAVALFATFSVRRDMQMLRLAGTLVEESEEKFRLLAENATDLITIFGGDGRMLYASPSAERLVGYPPHELLELDYTELVPEEDRETTRDNLRALFEGSDVRTTYAQRALTKGGEERWFETHVQSVRGEDGKTSRVYMSSRDITERVNAERELAASRELYRTLVRNLPDTAVFLFDRDFRYLLADGPRLLTAIGMTKEFVEGRTLQQVATPQNYENAARFYRQVLDGTTGSFTSTRDERVYITYGAPVHDASGQIVGGLLMTQDVTALKDAERKVLEQAQMLESVLDSMRDGVLVMDRNRRYVVANPAARRLFGISLGQESAPTWSSKLGVFKSDGITPFGADEGPLVRAMLGQPSDDVELLIRRPNNAGDTWARATGRPIRDDKGAVIAGVTIFHDTTERKRTETLLAAQADEERTRAMRDELTGLANRRGFLTYAALKLEAAVRTSTPVSVIFLDLNGMKKINDTLGHLEGDRALVDTAEILRNTFRDSDVIARLGGDEFVILAIKVGADAVERVKQRLSEAVDEHNRNAGRPYRISASVGFALYDPDNPETVEQLLARSDTLMYEQKRTRAPSAVMKAV